MKVFSAMAVAATAALAGGFLASGPLASAAFAGGGPVIGGAMAQTPLAADPVAVARAAIDRARPSLRCRYAFTLVERGQNDTIWSSNDLSQRQTLRFDPRQPPGKRWEILATTRTDRIYQRRVLNYGGRSDPKTDLLTLTLEGDVIITELALQSETAGQWVFGFTPRASPTVVVSAHSFLNALRGELTVDKASGEIVRRRIFLPEPFDAGVGRVREGDFVRQYATGANGAPMFRNGNQKLVTTVRGRGIDSTGEQSVRNVEAICDPAEVERIADMERATPNVERSDVKPPTGSRLWR